MITNVNMSEKFSLMWNDFQSNVVTSFSRLRGTAYFKDVTLVSDDQKQITAHRVVLSTCSGYFENILKHNTHSHPMLCLDNTTSKDLANILDYIYNGEIELLQEDVERFIEVAQRFKLEGLMAKESDHKEVMEKTYIKDESSLLSEASFQITTNKIEAAINSKFHSDQFNSIRELDNQIQKYIIKTSNGYQCSICGKISNKKFNLQEHIETHIEGLFFSCDNCTKVSRTRKAHRTHSCSSKSKLV